MAATRAGSFQIISCNNIKNLTKKKKIIKIYDNVSVYYIIIIILLDKIPIVEVGERGTADATALPTPLKLLFFVDNNVGGAQILDKRRVKNIIVVVVKIVFRLSEVFRFFVLHFI